jgi:hypothetical protein
MPAAAPDERTTMNGTHTLPLPAGARRAIGGLPLSVWGGPHYVAVACYVGPLGRVYYGFWASGPGEPWRVATDADVAALPAGALPNMVRHGERLAARYEARLRWEAKNAAAARALAA